MGEFRLDGAAEIERLLKQLPDKMAEKVTTGALRAGAAVIAKRARKRAEVHKDSGALASKVSSRRVRKQNKGQAQVSVGVARGALVVTRKGRKGPEKVVPARYAHLVEFGTQHSAAQPFLRPALDEGAREATEKIVAAMGRGINREAAKLAGHKKRR